MGFGVAHLVSLGLFHTSGMVDMKVQQMKGSSVNMKLFERFNRLTNSKKIINTGKIKNRNTRL